MNKTSESFFNYFRLCIKPGPFKIPRVSTRLEAQFSPPHLCYSIIASSSTEAMQIRLTSSKVCTDKRFQSSECKTEVFSLPHVAAPEYYTFSLFFFIKTGEKALLEFNILGVCGIFQGIDISEGFCGDRSQRTPTYDGLTLKLGILESC